MTINMSNKIMRNKISLIVFFSFLSTFFYGHISYAMERINKEMKKEEKLRKQLERKENDFIESFSQAVVHGLAANGFFNTSAAEFFENSREPMYFDTTDMFNKHRSVEKLSNILEQNHTILTAHEVKTKFLEFIDKMNNLINTSNYKNEFGEIKIKHNENEDEIILSFSLEPQATELLNKTFNYLTGEPFRFSINKKENKLMLLTQAKSKKLMCKLQDVLIEITKACIQKLDKKQSYVVNDASIPQWPIESITEHVSKPHKSKPNHNQNINNNKEKKPKKYSKKNNNKRQRYTKNNNNRKNNKTQSNKILDNNKSSKMLDTMSMKFIDENSYELSHANINPLDFTPQFGNDIISEPVKKISHKDHEITYNWITLLEIYGSLFKEITDSISAIQDELSAEKNELLARKMELKKLLEIISHGILVFDFHKIDDTNYLKAIINNLASIKLSIEENNILFATNPLFEQFQKAFVSYKDEQTAQRIEQLNFLLSLIKHHGDDLINRMNQDDQCAVNAVLYILGEHFVNLKTGVFALKPDCNVLFSHMRKFRNSVKHVNNTIDMSGNIIFMIGKNAEGEGSKLFRILQKYLEFKESDCFALKR